MCFVDDHRRFFQAESRSNLFTEATKGLGDINQRRCWCVRNRNAEELHDGKILSRLNRYNAVSKVSAEEMIVKRPSGITCQLGQIIAGAIGVLTIGCHNPETTKQEIHYFVLW